MIATKSTGKKKIYDTFIFSHCEGTKLTVFAYSFFHFSILKPKLRPISARFGRVIPAVPILNSATETAPNDVSKSYANWLLILASKRKSTEKIRDWHYHAFTMIKNQNVVFLFSYAFMDPSCLKLLEETQSTQPQESCCQ